MQDFSPCVIETTVSNPAEARKMARALVQERLAACVSISATDSIYRWQGNIEEEEEFVLNIKTGVFRTEELKDWFTHNHPYDCPQFVLMPINECSEDYKKWIEEQITPGEAG